MKLRIDKLQKSLSPNSNCLPRWRFTLLSLQRGRKQNTEQYRYWIRHLPVLFFKHFYTNSTRGEPFIFHTGWIVYLFQ